MTFVIVTKSDKTGICFAVDRDLCDNKIWSFSLKIAKQYNSRIRARRKKKKLTELGIDCMILTYEQAVLLKKYYEKQNPK